MSVAIVMRFSPIDSELIRQNRREFGLFQFGGHRLDFECELYWKEEFEFIR